MQQKMVRPGRGGARHGARNAASTARNSRTSYSTTRVDFEEVNGAVLLALLARWLPGGKRCGSEYIVRNPMRADKNRGSFKIAISGSRAGAWADFATSGKGGDVISLVAYVFKLSQVEAARRPAEMLAVRHV